MKTFLLALLAAVLFCPAAGWGQVDRKAGQKEVISKDDQAWSLRKSDPDQALSLAQEGLQLAEQLEYREGVASLHNTLGTIYLNQKAYDQAVLSFKMAIDLRRGLGLLEKEVNSLKNLGTTYQEMGNLDKALTVFGKVLQYCKRHDNKRIAASVAYGMGNVLCKQQKWDEALPYISQSRSLFARGNRTLNIGHCDQILGMIAYHQQELVTARERSTAAAEIYREEGYDAGLAIVYSQLGNICEAQAQGDLALTYNQLAKSISERSGIVEPMVSLNWGVKLYKTGDRSGAISATEQALNAAVDQSNKLLAAKAAHNLSAIHTELGHTREAANYREQVGTYLLDAKDPELSAAQFLEMGKYHLKRKEYKDAREALKKSLDHAKSANSLGAQLRAVINLKEVEKAVGNFEDALGYSEHENQLDDAISEDRLKQMADQSNANLHAAELAEFNNQLDSAETRVERLEVEKELAEYREQKANAEAEFLEKHSEELNAIIASQYNDIYILTIIGLILAMLAIILVVRYFYKRREFIELAKQKEYIDGQNEHIRRLLRELNHRVKNNLQFISALLNQQSRQLTDLQARQAIRDGLKRVDAIAQLHKKLYQGEDYQSINMGEYIRELSGDLNRSYGNASYPVQIDLDLDNVQLEVDTAISVGLIINELATNSFKHAFQPGKAGLLSLTLRDYPNGLCELIVSDNGPGLPNAPRANNGSFGLQLVGDLVQELNGELEVTNGGGTTYRLLFFKDPEVQPAVPISSLDPLLSIKQAS